MKVPRFLKRLAALTRGRRLDQDLDAEIAAHLELAEREALESGLSAEEARRTARIRFGSANSIREEHRDQRSLRCLDTFARDLRHGFAGIVRDPAFAAVSIGVLALGIGANTAMFSLVDATLLRPLPFPHPERLVRVWETPTPDSINGFTTLDFLDWKRLNTVFEAFSVERNAGMALTGSGEPTRLRGRLVSSDYFQVFGVHAASGRTFLPEEDSAGARPVVVLSYSTWKERFSGSEDVIGSEIILDSVPHTVVGVLPPGVFDRDDVQLWKPLLFARDQMNRGTHWLRSVGRLKPGVTLEQAQAQMSAIDDQLTELSPAWKRDWGVVVEPYDKRLIGDGLRRSIQVAFGAVALVLLIACANVANLLLAKGAARRREMAVRAALGANRRRLVGQLLTESLALCLAGASAGLLFAQLLVAVAAQLVAEYLPFTADVRLDPRVLAFSAAATLGVALLIGLLPSLRISFAKLSQTMSQGARGSSASGEGLRRTIVTAEVAVSLVLISGSMLLFKSLHNLQQVDPGVRVDNILTMSVNLPYSAYSTPASAERFYRAFLAELQSSPGIESAAFASDLPLEGVNYGEGLSAPGRDSMDIIVRFKRIDPHYLETLDIPVLAGRGIEERDGPGAPRVLLINEPLAARLLDAYQVDDPVGRTVRVTTTNYEGSAGESVEYQIAGLVRTERTDQPGAEQNPVVYVPLAQSPGMDLRLVVRSAGEPEAAMPAIRQAVRNVDPNLPLGDIRTMEQIRDSSLVGARQPTWVIGAFAAAAVLLAALGLYGVLSHAVAQQRREIGIRLALGAQPTDILRRTLVNAFGMLGAGLALGLAGALALTRVIESMLFGVSALDPAALGAACLATVLVGLAAGLLPARRAAKVQPMNVLREEG